VAFIDSFDRLQGQAFVDWVRAHMDVGLFLKAMATDVAPGQTDGYWANTNNFNFYFDEEGLRFQPADADRRYQVTADLDAGDYSFKVADADWSAATDFGAWPGSERLTLSIPYGLAQKARVAAVQNLNIRLPESGRYAFRLDTDQACRAEPVCEGTAITRADNGGRSVSDIFVDQPGTYAITFNDETYQYRFERLEDAGGGQ
jgi:hypothetical protein